MKQMMGGDGLAERFREVDEHFAAAEDEEAEEPEYVADGVMGG